MADVLKTKLDEKDFSQSEPELTETVKELVEHMNSVVQENQ